MRFPFINPNRIVRRTGIGSIGTIEVTTADGKTHQIEVPSSANLEQVLKAKTVQKIETVIDAASSESP